MQQQMEYIYTIYRLGSIRQAAEQLCITQPALSISLKKAEDDLGELIFDRSKHPLELTPAGRIYIESIRKIRQIEQNMKSEIEDLSGMNTGTLIIGGTQYFTSYILPPVLKHYMELYPGIEISIEESTSDDILKKLTNNEIDLMFNARTFPSDRFFTMPIFHDTLLVAVPRSLIVFSDLEAQGMTYEDITSNRYLIMEAMTDFHQMAHLPFIVLTKENNLYQRSMEFFYSAGILPNICMRVQQLTTAHYFSCSGIGATFTTDKLVQRSAASDLLYYKADLNAMSRTFNVILPRNRYLSNAAKKFIALCESDLA